MYDFDEPCNDDRAGWVADFVREFATEHYHGPEYVEIIVMDLISDLGHFLDRSVDYDLRTSRGEEIDVDPAYCQPGGGDYTFRDVLDGAWEHYDYEFREELEEVEA